MSLKNVFYIFMCVWGGGGQEEEMLYLFSEQSVVFRSAGLSHDPPPLHKRTHRSPLGPLSRIPRVCFSWGDEEGDEEYLIPNFSCRAVSTSCL